MAILYVIAQLIGATLGFRLLQALTPAKVFALSSGEYGVCATVPYDELTELDAFFIEFIATSVLISICCALWDPRNSNKQDSVAVKFGLAITILSVIFGPATGCSMNPVRTFAPAFWAQNYPAHWVCSLRYVSNRPIFFTCNCFNIIKLFDFNVIGLLDSSNALSIMYISRI